MTEPIIEFKDFSFKYNSQAEPTLKNINLKINKGEKILLAGPSGSGKSTIGRCLNGLIPNINQGEVKGKCLVNGKDITSTSLFDFSFTTSTILQDADSQFIGLTVGEDIAFALENDCQPKDKMHQTVNQWADELKIKELLTQSPQSLSGGQKQIVALAGVLVDESPILLFDEPLANLDPASGLKTMAIIDKIQKELNATVIIIEHRVEEVLSQPIDRIILVNEGTIVADQLTNQLLHSHTLEKIGVREPLYLKALTAADVNLSSIKEVDQISTLPVSEKISDKLAAWTKHAKITKKEADNLPLLKIDDVGHQ